MAFHVRPCIRTAMSMILSSSGVHISPFLLPAPKYAPPAASQLFSVRDLGLGADMETLAPRRFLGGLLLSESHNSSSTPSPPLLTATKISCRRCLDINRCHRLRTASSVRDSGKSRAILAQLCP